MFPVAVIISGKECQCRGIMEREKEDLAMLEQESYAFKIFLWLLFKVHQITFINNLIPNQSKYCSVYLFF